MNLKYTDLSFLFSRFQLLRQIRVEIFLESYTLKKFKKIIGKHSKLWPDRNYILFILFLFSLLGHPVTIVGTSFQFVGSGDDSDRPLSPLTLYMSSRSLSIRSTTEPRLWRACITICDCRSSSVVAVAVADDTCCCCTCCVNHVPD